MRGALRKCKRPRNTGSGVLYRRNRRGSAVGSQVYAAGPAVWTSSSGYSTVSVNCSMYCSILISGRYHSARLTSLSSSKSFTTHVQLAPAICFQAMRQGKSMRTVDTDGWKENARPSEIEEDLFKAFPGGHMRVGAGTAAFQSRVRSCLCNY